MIAELYRCVNNGQKPLIKGGNNKIYDFALSVEQINNSNSTIYPPLANFTSWEQILEFSNSDRGKHILQLVKIVEQYGARSLIKLYDSFRYADENNYDVLIASAHNCKGLEFNKVRLGCGFKTPEDDKYNKEESNLLYVAATRAIEKLDINNCKAFANYVPF